MNKSNSLPLVNEVYVTTKTSANPFGINPQIGTHYVIEDVQTSTEDEDEEFSLIIVVQEEDKNDMNAIAEELSLEEWLDFSAQLGLKKVST